MKQALAVFIVVVCSSFVMARSGQNRPSAAAPSAFDQTLMDAEKSFLAAAKKGDAGFLKRTLTDDFSFVAFDGQLSSRQEMVDQFSEPGTDILPYEMKVVPLGENAAIVTYNVVLRVPVAEDQGPPPSLSALQHCLGEARR